MKRLFEIQTLSDYTTLGDPVTVLTGSIAVLSQLFPNIFGGGRIRLTNAHWMEMFPGNGMWTVRLRNYLSSTIHYDVDMQNVEQFTRYFVDINKNSIPGSNFTEKFQNLLNIIAEEKYTGGKSPGGMIPGIPGGIDYSTLLPIGLGVVILVLMMKNKKG